jgi:hypothetical protein
LLFLAPQAVTEIYRFARKSKNARVDICPWVVLLAGQTGPASKPMLVVEFRIFLLGTSFLYLYPLFLIVA